MQEQETRNTPEMKTTARLIIERICVPFVTLALLATFSMRVSCEPPGETLHREVSASSISQVITVVAAGDVSLARGVKTAVDEGIDPFDSIRDVVISADLAICNLECALTEETEHATGKGPYGGGIYLAGRPSSAGLLADAGFDVICLANNHTMDYGVTGLEDTMDALDSVGLARCGAGFDEEEARVPAIIDLGGFVVYCFAFSEVEPRLYSAGPDKGGVAWFDRATVLNAINKAEKEADLIVVSIHWGIEGVAEPTYAQKNMARAMVDAGADVILGHHAHVPGPVETYSGAVIAYGLGNFVFDTVFPSRRTSLLLTVYVDKRTGPVGYTLTPVKIEGASPEISAESAAEFVTLTG